MDHTPNDPSTLDRAGILASALCAAHCLLCALAPAALAALGLGVLLGHAAEWAFTAIAILIASGALALGWRRHRSRLVVALMVLGFAALLASRGLETSSEHHDDDDAPHADAAPHAKAPHAEAHHDDDGGAHLAGAGLGALGGLLIVAGHAVNLRAQRRRAAPPETCCETC